MRSSSEIASLAVDDLMSEFLAPSPLPAKAKSKEVPRVPESVKVAESAVDDLLVEFEIDAVAQPPKSQAQCQLEFVNDDGEGQDENQNKLNVGINKGPQHETVMESGVEKLGKLEKLEKLPTKLDVKASMKVANRPQKPKTPPSKSKKVKGGRRPKYRPHPAPTSMGSSAGSGETEVTEVGGIGELGGSLLEETEVIRAPVIPAKNSRYLREREDKKKEEEDLARKAKKRIARMKREKKERELRRKMELEEQQRQMLATLEKEARLRKQQQADAERVMEEEKEARARRLQQREERVKARGRSKERDNSSNPNPNPNRRRSRDSVDSQSSRGQNRGMGGPLVPPKPKPKPPLFQRMREKADARIQAQVERKNKRALAERRKLNQAGGVDRIKNFASDYDERLAERKRKTEERLRRQKAKRQDGIGERRRRKGNGVKSGWNAGNSPESASSAVERERNRAEAGRRVMERANGNGRLTRAQRAIVHEKEQRAAKKATEIKRKRENLDRKKKYAERLRNIHNPDSQYQPKKARGRGGPSGRSAVPVETSSDIGYRNSPRVSDDGVISLPAIPVRRGASNNGVSPRGGGRALKMTEEQIRNNRFREAKIKANEQQKAVYEREERRMEEMRMRTSAIALRRQQMDNGMGGRMDNGGMGGTPRGGGRRPVSREEEEWLERVAVEDERETEQMASMYRKSKLAERFKAMQQGLA
ncbi:hypothetical protein TL16_g10736 [Triparma laevis f. inornata]|uniref:Uncharacterized protein n=1 Tax=Triparma laevis f. inornata TaxID=1714386 RepID=A0A9W7BAX3_9STRA|nr:hypothetical protein TL16_g10736 [Triparma laevis f. inornata]